MPPRKVGNELNTRAKPVLDLREGAPAVPPRRTYAPPREARWQVAPRPRVLPSHSPRPLNAPASSTRRAPTLPVPIPSHQAPVAGTRDVSEQPSLGLRSSKWGLKIPARKVLIINGIKVFVLLLLGAVILSTSWQLVEQLIALYAVAALLFSIDSRRTFLVALIFLILVAGFSALNNQLIAENYAVYAFYFLVIGLASAIVELAREKGVQSG